MLRHYQPIPIFELRLSARNERLRLELLDAPHTYSTANAEISMASYRESEGQPVILRRALALAALFGRMPVYIREGELLAGNRSGGLGVMPRLPEEFVKAESPRSAENDARYEAAGIFPRYAAALSREVKDAEACLLAGYPAGSVAGFGHILADYGMVVREGAVPLAEKAEAWAKQFAERGDEEKADFCRASAIACRGFAAWGGRYAALAREQATACGDASRRAELERMAAICERVPAYPARSFHEALQAMLFAHQAMSVEQQAGSISIGGFDRILLPYYEADMERGVAVAFVQELVEAFYIKLMENAIWPREVVNFCNMAVGGADSRGYDRSNDLTWIALDTVVKTRSTHPLLSFRWHPGVDKALWERVISVVGIGTGLPAIFSDPLMTASLESWGVPRETAWDYGVVGCVEPALNGLLHGQTLGGHINLLLCLELALNDGRRLGREKRIGPATGLLRDFGSMEDIRAAYRIQVRHACACNREAVFAAAAAQRECFGYPLMSSFMHGAVENGRDLTGGVAYNFPTVCVTGATNVVDSLLSIEELAAGGRSFAALYEAILHDYVGHEELHAEIRASENRFGNGRPRYPELYNEICEEHTAVLKSAAGPRGGTFEPGLWTTTWHVRQGEYTGASLDGRRAGDPLADCAGPVSGRAVRSPGAMARDMAGIDAVRHYPGGYVFNQRFSGSLFQPADSAQIEKLAGFIDVFFRMGGMQMQINVHSRELLLEAQRHPEQYKDLIVRVAGFSAYFASLGAGVQNEIISRAQVEV